MTVMVGFEAVGVNSFMSIHGLGTFDPQISICEVRLSMFEHCRLIRIPGPYRRGGMRTVTTANLPVLFIGLPFPPTACWFLGLPGFSSYSSVTSPNRSAPHDIEPQLDFDSRVCYMSLHFGLPTSIFFLVPQRRHLWE
jgi:hypothetical protein